MILLYFGSLNAKLILFSINADYSNKIRAIVNKKLVNKVFIQSVIFERKRDEGKYFHLLGITFNNFVVCAMPIGRVNVILLNAEWVQIRFCQKSVISLGFWYWK